MRIVVNHLTRMGSPRICVAGIDPETLEHVRPTTPPTDLITRRLLRENGGPFRVGASVELGPVMPRPSPPETEDHDFYTHRATHVEDLPADEFLSLLEAVSAQTLGEAFGPDLERIRWKYAVDPGCGIRSLAVVPIRGRPVLEVDERYGKLQLRFDDPAGRAYLGVTDVRMFEEDQVTPSPKIVGDVARRLRKGVDGYLMLGLARAYKAPSDDRERHWLQLNGIVLADRPVGDQP